MTRDDFKIGDKVIVNRLGSKISRFKEGQEVVVVGFLGSNYLGTSSGRMVQFLTVNQIALQTKISEPREIDWV